MPEDAICYLQKREPLQKRKRGTGIRLRERRTEQDS